MAQPLPHHLGEPLGPARRHARRATPTPHPRGREPRMTTAPATERSTEHATFTIERVYPHRPSHVFAAFADLKVKARWFGDVTAVRDGSQALDFCEGGTERLHMSLPSGTRMTY